MTNLLSTLIVTRVTAALNRVTGMPPDLIKLEMPIDALGADALDLLEIALELETEFSIEVSDGEMHQAGTVGELCALVESKLETANV